MTEKPPPPKKPDRPFECGECKKPIKVIYTEIVGNNITHTSMCADCPELQKRLHGASYLADAGIMNEPGAGLACGIVAHLWQLSGWRILWDVMYVMRCLRIFY